MKQDTGVLREAYSNHRYRILFFTLLASLVALPAVRPLGLGSSVVEGFLAANLVAAVFAFGEGRLRRFAFVALFIALVARPGAALFHVAAVSVGSLAVWGVLALLAAAGALRFALQGQSVGAEQMFAALSAYVLGGLFFGLLYWVMGQFTPGSIVEGGAPVPSVFTAIYFSFVTLASLGYGDVLPVSDPARGLAVIEAVGGQLYLAVMVARLVSAWR